MTERHESLQPETAAVKEVVRRHWDGRAASFDEGTTHGLLTDAQRSAWTDRVRAWAGPGPVDALDVGCGTGFFSLLLAELGHRPTGVDVAESMLARTREKAAAAGLTVDLRLADTEALPFPDDSFDLVIERHVIWTLPEPTRALSEWARVLRPGGQLILVEGEWGGLRAGGHGDYDAIREALPLYGGRPAAELAEIVRAGGFTRSVTEPLMTAELWVTEPERERYALRAWS